MPVDFLSFSYIVHLQLQVCASDPTLSSLTFFTENAVIMYVTWSFYSCTVMLNTAPLGHIHSLLLRQYSGIGIHWSSLTGVL